MANVLVVDDSAIMRINIKSILAQAGHNVVAEAETATQAYCEYQKYHPDLVTMDINMPGISGIEGTKKILQTYPDAKIIIVSSLEQKNQVVDALEAGALHYVLKPITMEKLLSRIGSVLGDNTDAEEDNEKEKIEENNEEEKVEENIEEKKEEPFLVINKNGVFVIKINGSMDMEGLEILKKVMYGLSFVKPLQVIFDFNEIKSIEMTIYNGLVDLAKNLFEKEADVKVIVKNSDLHKFIIHNNINSYAKIYKDMSEIENENISDDKEQDQLETNISK